MSGGFVGCQNHYTTVSLHYIKAYVMSSICTPTTFNQINKRIKLGNCKLIGRERGQRIEHTFASKRID